MPPLHVVLDRPRIAGNIGAVARLCAGTGAALHVCGPLDLGGSTAEMRRAGLDYWGLVRLHFHLSLSRCLELLEPEERLWVMETGEGVPPSSADLRRGTVVVLGPEDGSVADEVQRQAGPRRITLPTRPGVRSLNLAQCAAVVVFEALRQQGVA